MKIIKKQRKQNRKYKLNKRCADTNVNIFVQGYSNER